MENSSYSDLEPVNIEVAYMTRPVLGATRCNRKLKAIGSAGSYRSRINPNFSVPCALGVACSQGNLSKKIVNFSPHAWLDLAPDQGPFAEYVERVLRA